MHYDLIVVGSGIVGLAQAFEGASRGLKVAVIERDSRPVGASIRNFGFITVTGQAAGDTYRRARISRDIWNHIADEIDSPIIHRGLWMVAQRQEALAVLEEFMQTEIAEGCELFSVNEAAKRVDSLNLNHVTGLLYSPHELRMESREVIPKLVAWLRSRWGVTFHFGETVLDIATPKISTSQGEYRAERVVYCPGTLLHGPFATRIAEYGLLLCRLQMMRIRPRCTITLPGAVMMDLSLVRYDGYAKLPAAAVLKQRLAKEETQSLAEGIHLIAVQSADGSLVVGDSHHYDASPEPFASAEVESLILRHMEETINVGDYDVVERWVGEYPSSTKQNAIIDAPDAATRMVIVSSGTGASTAFGLAKDTFSNW